MRFKIGISALFIPKSLPTKETYIPLTDDLLINNIEKPWEDEYKLRVKFNQLPQEDKIEVYNLLRFPKSNARVAIQCLKGLYKKSKENTIEFDSLIPMLIRELVLGPVKTISNIVEIKNNFYNKYQNHVKQVIDIHFRKNFFQRSLHLDLLSSLALEQIENRFAKNNLNLLQANSSNQIEFEEFRIRLLDISQDYQ